MSRFVTIPDIRQVPATEWRALAASDNPFVDHAFLAALEQSGSIRPQWGWSPTHLLLRDGERLAGAIAAYRKTNSHGEFVFDHAWAEAHERLGIDYYPKLLAAVPYSPVPGPRLFAGGDDAVRLRLAKGLVDHARTHGWSSAHVNFTHDDDGAALAKAGFLQRQDIQFHWRNEGYHDFADFLARLNAKRRKEARRERERVARDGWRVEWLDGNALTDAQVSLVYELYARTFDEKGNHPALTRAFFLRIARALGERFLVALATDPDGAHAAAVCLRSHDTLYGRYWGSQRHTPGLHFEVCYYQGIEYCIANGLRYFEPGAQGEHKLARGFLPVRTQSWHWIAHEVLRDAIARALQRERAWFDRYETSLLQHSPYAEASA